MVTSIAFDSLLNSIWKPLVEFSHFFRELTCTTLYVDQLMDKQCDILSYYVSWNKVFLQDFLFNGMSSYSLALRSTGEWSNSISLDVSIWKIYISKYSNHFMPFYLTMMSYTIVILRFLRSLKEKVKNQAGIKGSICQACLLEETFTFDSFNYRFKINTRRTRMPQNVGGGEGN